MNIWLLFLSIYPYVAIAIFFMGLLWKYDKKYLKETYSKLQAFSCYAVRSFFTVLLLMQICITIASTQTAGYHCPLMAIVTFQFNYQFVFSADFYTNATILLLSSLLVLFPFTPNPNTY
ncbi:MAG: respiratory nitrate reductase subunit gamma [Bacillus sp. (in: Bacteria)]|nr:respiratory nitrate reductase subunit gamma [Bacillus sp. (in: firmicutes)]